MNALGTGTLAAGITILMAGGAQALSCMRPQIEQSFNWWADAEERYYIGVGTLTALEPLPNIPDPGAMSFGGAEPRDLSAPFRFEGYLIGGSGDMPLDTTITVEIGCAGPWCGGFPADGTHGLMPLEVKDARNLSLRMGACPGTIFDASVEPTVRGCLAAGRCTESQNNHSETRSD